MAADGSIIIDTRIDTDGIISGRTDINKQIDSLAEHTKSAAQTINNSIGGAFSKSAETSRINIEKIAADIRRMESDYASVSDKLKEALYADDDVKAERLGAQQDRLYDRILISRKKLELEVKAAAARQAEAEEEAAQRTAQANQKSAANAKKIVKPTAQVAKNMSKAEKSTSGFGKRLKSIALSAFVFNVISAGLRRLTDTIWNAISSTTEMKTAMSNLKGAAYTAASPLINVLSKAFAVLANAAATALSYVTQLYSFLTGKSLKGISNTAEQMANVADAADSTAGSAEKAKKSLAGFDELNVLSTDQDASGGGGAGGTAPNYDYGLDSGISPFIEEVAEKINELIEPLKNIDFTPLMTSLQTLGDSFIHLAAVIGESLEWVWTDLLVPLAEWTIEEAAPAAVEMLAAAFDLLAAVIEPVVNGLDQMLEYLAPIIDFIKGQILLVIQKWIEKFELIAAVFKEKAPQIEKLLKNLGEGFELLWDVIGPVCEWIQDVWSKTMTFMNEETAIGIGYLIDIFYGLSEFILGVFTGDWERAWGGVEYIFDSTGEAIRQTAEALEKATGINFTGIYNWASEKFNGVKTTVLSAWDAIKNSQAWQTISNSLNTAWTNLKTKATTTFQNMKTSIVNIFTALKNALKTPINAIIGFINKMISGIVSGINAAIRALNGLNISIPSWVPVVGGNSLGFHIATLNAPQIPYLAKGAVIPPNAPFMAMLGDQRHGTNIEAPLETIQEAVALVMDNMTGGVMTGFEAIVAVLSDILEAILGIEIGDEVIANAVNNYNRKMAVVNGG